MQKATPSNQFADQIVAFIPVYDDRGDSTSLLLQDGTSQTEQRGIRSCLRDFWRHYSFDWATYRSQYAELLNRRNLLPWPADVWRTFAPVKLRSPQIGRDAAYGYVAVEYVQSILPVNQDATPISLLLLKNGHCLTVYLSEEEIHSSLQSAAYAFWLYWGKRITLRPTTEEIR